MVPLFSRRLNPGRPGFLASCHPPSSARPLQRGFRGQKDVEAGYRSRFSTSRTLQQPSGLHETMISKFSQSLGKALPKDREGRLTISHNETIVGFKGEHALTRTCPDFSLQHRDGSGNYRPLLAFELVFTSGSDEKLERLARLWIEGTDSTSVVMAIKIYEYPIYKSPPPEHYLSDETMPLPTLTSMRQDSVYLQDPDDPSSPLLINGLPYAGRLLVEFRLWTRNQDGRAQPAEYLIIYGDATPPPDLEILLSRFLPQSYGVGGKKWVLHWKDITSGIEHERRKLARTRHWEAIKRHQKKLHVEKS